MRIDIDDDLAITSDKYQVILVRKQTIQSGAMTGQQIDTPIGFYHSLPNLIQALPDYWVRTSQAASLLEARDDLIRRNTQLATALEAAINRIVREASNLRRRKAA